MNKSQPKKVLYVEDSPVNIFLVQTIFESRLRVELLTAPDGSIGLELARQHHPDLILLDLNLPDMDGEEYLRRLRAIESEAHTPVVIVSGDAVDEHDTRFCHLGVADYLAKPFNLERFEQVMGRFLSHQAPG